jgi:hypothetical protein
MPPGMNSGNMRIPRACALDPLINRRLQALPVAYPQGRIIIVPRTGPSTLDPEREPEPGSPRLAGASMERPARVSEPPSRGSGQRDANALLERVDGGCGLTDQLSTV